eukprot:CAMPEP_0185749146 /NCGR_PEP_ID=MMETSP1174-20130828/7884_1 /TAXON_ID=35687 /ORGANISM="Dictyocha speculum, Strain CCMP1381" /LENGTH=47 /DNA_ID= /DNA_START= /DNA_END= /DNA_ORIENTATION=
MATQHDDGSAAGGMTMAAQQEVLAMQEAELQGVMPAKIAGAVLVVVS